MSYITGDPGEDSSKFGEKWPEDTEPVAPPIDNSRSNAVGLKIQPHEEISERMETNNEIDEKLNHERPMSGASSRRARPPTSKGRIA